MVHRVVTKALINASMAFADRLVVTINWILTLNWINVVFATVIMIHAMILSAISDPNKSNEQKSTVKRHTTIMSQSYQRGHQILKFYSPAIRTISIILVEYLFFFNSIKTNLFLFHGCHN